MEQPVEPPHAVPTPARRKRRAVRTIHRMTAPLRVLPSFLIIGAQRSGTSSLSHYLNQHPSVVRTNGHIKEVHFFDRNYERGPSWYRAHFATSAYVALLARRRGGPVLTGDSTPYYLFHPLVAKRVRQLLPDVRLIVLLRNPVDRAFSQYHHEVGLGFEDRSFEEALAREEERLHGEAEKMLQDEEYKSFSHSHHSYRARGEYASQLEAWMQYFPRKQFLIIKAEHLFKDATATFRQVTAFLDLPDWEPTRYTLHNAGRYPKIAPEIRDDLARYFEPHNRRLYELLGVDFGWNAVSPDRKNGEYGVPTSASKIL